MKTNDIEYILFTGNGVDSEENNVRMMLQRTVNLTREKPTLRVSVIHAKEL